jgi:hypothetical protein
MAEKHVLIGIVPQVIAIGPGDQVVWVCDSGNIKIEFDANRCPFLSNVFQAPEGVRLLSGVPRPGAVPTTYKYSLFLNDLRVGTAEVVLREK